MFKRGRLWAIALLLALGAGCTENYSIVILRNSPSEEECSADLGGELFQGAGDLDVTSPLPDGTSNPGYVLTPVVQSGVAPPPGNAGNPMGHLAFVEGAEIEIVSDGSEASNRVVSALASAGVASRIELFSVGVTPGGLTGFAFKVIDAQQTQVMNGALSTGEIVVVRTRTRIFGEIDGNDFESTVFTYPVTLHKGGLLRDVGLCNQYAPGTPFAAGGLCGPLQDAVLACCREGTSTFCPAIGTMPAPVEP